MQNPLRYVRMQRLKLEDISKVLLPRQIYIRPISLTRHYIETHGKPTRTDSHPESSQILPHHQPSNANTANFSGKFDCFRPREELLLLGRYTSAPFSFVGQVPHLRILVTFTTSRRLSRAGKGECKYAKRSAARSSIIVPTKLDFPFVH